MSIKLKVSKGNEGMAACQLEEIIPINFRTNEISDAPNYLRIGIRARATEQ